jgi:hypothetical protein
MWLQWNLLSVLHSGPIPLKGCLLTELEEAIAKVWLFFLLLFSLNGKRSSSYPFEQMAHDQYGTV